MTTTYRTTVTREDGWWMIHVPEIDGLTQARRLADAGQMARELIAVTLDAALDDIEVDVSTKHVAGLAAGEIDYAVSGESPSRRP